MKKASRQRKFIVCILTLALISALCAPALAADSEGAWSYSVIASPQFEDVRPFSDGFAAVKLDGKWGYINAKGKIVIEPQYTLASDFYEGKAVVSLDDPSDPENVMKIWGIDANWSVIDQNGAVICALEDSKVTDAESFMGSHPIIPLIRSGNVYIAQSSSFYGCYSCSPMIFSIHTTSYQRPNFLPHW